MRTEAQINAEMPYRQPLAVQPSMSWMNDRRKSGIVVHPNRVNVTLKTPSIENGACWAEPGAAPPTSGHGRAQRAARRVSELAQSCPTCPVFQGVGPLMRLAAAVRVKVERRRFELPTPSLQS